LSKRLLRKLSKRLLQNAMSQRTEDAVNISRTLSAQPVGVQDGIGAVLQFYTKALTKLLLMPKNVALRSPRLSLRRSSKRLSYTLRKPPRRSLRLTQRRQRRWLRKPRNLPKRW